MNCITKTVEPENGMHDENFLDMLAMAGLPVKSYAAYISDTDCMMTQIYPLL